MPQKDRKNERRKPIPNPLTQMQTGGNNVRKNRIAIYRTKSNIPENAFGFAFELKNMP